MDVYRYCPICGLSLSLGEKHQCPQVILNAIDAANTRAEDGEPHVFTIIRDEAERLLHGLEIMEVGEDPTEYFDGPIKKEAVWYDKPIND